MKTTSEKAFYRAPRILGIATGLFISLFALDVFNEGYKLRDTLAALAMHLLPTGVIVIALILAWR